MKYVKGCLIQCFIDGRFDILIHQMNCFHNFTTGLAKSIAKAFPAVKKVDLMTPTGSRDKKFGRYSVVALEREKKVSLLVNLYSQFRTNGYFPRTSYNKMRSGLEMLRDELLEAGYFGYRIGIPLMGCGGCGGSWFRVKEIIMDVLDPHFDVTVYLNDSSERTVRSYRLSMGTFKGKRPYTKRDGKYYILQ